MDELGLALGKMRGGKAGGKTDNLPEIILAGGKEFRSRLPQLVVKVWMKHRVVDNWWDCTHF